jgi:inorganic pyrophosphatase
MSEEKPPLDRLPAWDAESGMLQVIVDTTKGSPIKFKHDAKKNVYRVAHVLSAGLVFPFDFGSIPSTAADDGDPLDALILLEAPTFPGCLVPVRLLGALEAKQTTKGKTERNDRLIGAAAESRVYRDWKDMDDVPEKVLDEIEHFFVSYNEARGRKFRVTRRVGAAAAKRLVAAGEKRFERN